VRVELKTIGIAAVTHNP